MTDSRKKSITVDKWDSRALKNVLDDAAKQVFTKRFGCTELHSLMNGRLLLGTIAVGFALFAAAWDFLFPFPASRPVLIACVVLYSFMMIVLGLYASYKEKRYFMVAMEKNQVESNPDNIWSLSSNIKSYDDAYELRVIFKDGASGQVRKIRVETSVAHFFDDDGFLCQDLFKKKLKNLHLSLLSDKKNL